MTFEERIERLTERHEALAQSVELMLAEAKEQRAKAEEQTKQIELLFATATKDGEHIRALVRLAEIHERRLTHLEGGEDGL
jgi:hypothetical protein